MAAQKTFVDTSGFYSLLVKSDSRHAEAVSIVQSMRESGVKAFTSDYIIDETTTLLKARRLGHLNSKLFSLLDTAQALELHFVGEENFKRSRDYFERHSDHGYSFTDCTSFVLMRELRMHSALTKDNHFSQAGFKALLATL
jgi:predicted nucleic acid-binding protein